MPTEKLLGPYIVWQNYGPEGWQPRSYLTLKDATLDIKYNEYVITKLVVVGVFEEESERDD